MGQHNNLIVIIVVFDLNASGYNLTLKRVGLCRIIGLLKVFIVRNFKAKYFDLDQASGFRTRNIEYRLIKNI